MNSGRPKMDKQKIKAWLDSEHRKQSYLREQLGVSQSLVDQMLGGRPPRLQTLIKLARLMGCAVEDLLLPEEAKKAS